MVSLSVLVFSIVRRKLVFESRESLSRYTDEIERQGASGGIEESSTMEKIQRLVAII